MARIVKFLQVEDKIIKIEPLLNRTSEVASGTTMSHVADIMEQLGWAVAFNNDILYCGKTTEGEING